MLLLIAASAAILMPLILLVVFKLPAKHGMSISAVVVTLAAILVWGMTDTAVAASVLQGLHRATTVLWILLGAMTLLKVSEYTGALERIRQAFFAISGDMRVLTVIVGLFFVSVLEGVAGFGAPVAIAAPLLLALGLRPMAAIVIALIGDSLAVAFGAVGTPILVGLSNVPGYGEDNFFASISQLVTSIDFLVAVMLPAVMILALVKMFGESPSARRLNNVKELLPWALMMGLVYAVSAVILSRYIGPEFISTISGLIALAVSVITAKKAILLPEQRDWQTHSALSHAAVPKNSGNLSLLQASSPYLLLLIGLIATRFIEPIKQFTLSFGDLSLSGIFGLEAISSAWQILYSPGTVMIVSAFLALLIMKSSYRVGVRAVSASSGLLVKAALALFPTLIMVQIFSNTGINTSGLVSMPAYIAQSLAAVFGPIWVAVAPILGATGAFITGSSTVSTLTMAEIQYNIANLAGLHPELVLAQQLSGAAAGNMIAIHNIIAASAVVGVYHQEGSIIRRVLPFVGTYLALSIVGAIIVSLVL